MSILCVLYVSIDRVGVRKLLSEEVKVGVNSMQDTDKVSLKLYQEQKNFQEYQETKTEDEVNIK